MGRFKSVDGSETAPITLRLPTWLIERAGQQPGGAREHLRSIIITAMSKGHEERGEDSHGE